MLVSIYFKRIRPLFFTCLFFLSSVIATATFPAHAFEQSKLLASPTKFENSKNVSAMLGQKLILDFRYYCDDDTPSVQCRKPMTEIPEALLNVLSNYNIGGVILFAENITDYAQLITLNYTMQQHMKNAGRPPLFIAIDQEGGRVARLPDNILLPFSGNMAIGATYEKHGTSFSKSVAEHVGKTLFNLGINTNFAPSVDINSEPKNPVINVRSFSENPQHVAALGKAFVGAMQRTGTIAALKHFPGHGDTHIDSHSGLPQVSHSKKEAMTGDILPFANIINSDMPPAMIMSAHIQYPALDSTTLLDKHGNTQIVPATLSRIILTDLLRTQLGFEGLIVSDALDMAGIAQFFTEEEAIIRTFQAGADIALMPFRIRNENDIRQFARLLERITAAINNNRLESAFLRASFKRIYDTKQRFKLDFFTQVPLESRIKAFESKKRSSNSLFAQQRQVDSALAAASLSLLYGEQNLPLTVGNDNVWFAVMPDAARCFAFETAFEAAIKSDNLKPTDNNTANKSEWLTCVPLTNILDEELLNKYLREADTVVVGNITPLHAQYEMRGLDSKESLQHRATQSQVNRFTKQFIKQAKSLNKTVVFAPLRMPYLAAEVENDVDVAIATFNYGVTIHHADMSSVTDIVNAKNPQKSRVTSASFEALMKVLLGEQKAVGQSPVTWHQPAN